MSKSLDVTCALVFADPADRICVLGVTKNDKSLSLTGVYEPNDHVEQSDLFQQIKPFLTTSHWAVLAGEWNAILDPDLESYRRKTRY